MTPTPRELAEVITDLVNFRRPGEMADAKRRVIAWAMLQTSRPPESRQECLVRTFGETMVPPSMPIAYLEDE